MKFSPCFLFLFSFNLALAIELKSIGNDTFSINFKLLIKWCWNRDAAKHILNLRINSKMNQVHEILILSNAFYNWENRWHSLIISMKVLHYIEFYKMFSSATKKTWFCRRQLWTNSKWHRHRWRLTSLKWNILIFLKSYKMPFIDWFHILKMAKFLFCSL